jgi:hypothetical protein
MSPLAAAAGRKGRRRRRSFSLNGLAIQISAFALSFTLVALLVVTGSHAAFVDQAENVLNHVSGTDVELGDSGAGTAMFPDDVLSTGTVLDRCIEVTYTGNIDPQPVLLYAAGGSGDLAPYLDLTIEFGPSTGGMFSSCAGFAPERTLYAGTLAGFAAAHPDYASGVSAWDPAAGGEGRSFRFRISVQDDPAASGATATFGFTWEARGQ